MSKETIAYCVKCKTKREMNSPKEITMKGKGDTKRRAMTGICPTCGTKMLGFSARSKIDCF